MHATRPARTDVPGRAFAVALAALALLGAIAAFAGALA